MKKRSFFERLTGSVDMDEYNDEPVVKNSIQNLNSKKENPASWMEEEEDAELTVDVYQTANDIVVQTMVAGVRPEDLDIVITRDMITIRGKREESRTINEENYFSKELYWGSFSRTISLPEEVDPEESEATEKHGLLTIKLPKIDKEKKKSVKVKSL